MALVPFPGPQSGALRLPPEDDEDDDFSGGKMSFLEHLDELRKRILNSVIAIAVGVGVSFFFIERLVHFVLEPTLASLPEGSQHDLHAAAGGVLALHRGRAALRDHLRRAVHHVAGLAFHCAGVVHEREEARDSVRVPLDRGVSWAVPRSATSSRFR